MDDKEFLIVLAKFFDEEYGYDPGNTADWIEGHGYDVEEFLAKVKATIA